MINPYSALRKINGCVVVGLIEVFLGYYIVNNAVIVLALSHTHSLSHTGTHAGQVLISMTYR